MSNTDLEALRRAINNLDKSLLELFAKRRELSLSVAEYKYDNALNIRDQHQEQKLLTQLISDAKSLGLDTSTTLGLFHSIIEDSLRTQYDYFISKESSNKDNVKLAILGDQNSYSSIAANNHFSTKKQKFRPEYFNSFQKIFKAVVDGECDYGLIPIENTCSGNIPEIHDLIRDYQIKIVGEEKLRVKHCLIGLPQAKLEDIKDVYSHPQAIIQSQSYFIKQPQIKTHIRSSTSDALKLMEEYQNPSIAVVASEEAAMNVGLKILKNGINDYQNNFTRFILISNSKISVPEKIPAKTSVILTTKQEAGSLSECLNILKQHNINMTKIESRPIIEKPWQERFYIDLEGNLESISVQQAMRELEVMSSQLDIVGCYPKHDILATHLDLTNLS